MSGRKRRVRIFYLWAWPSIVIVIVIIKYYVRFMNENNVVLARLHDREHLLRFARQHCGTRAPRPY